MLNVHEIYEARREAAQSSASERRQWALQRMEELRRARASGRIDQKTFLARLRYWQKVAAGSPVSIRAAQMGAGPTVEELKTTGTFF